MPGTTSRLPKQHHYIVAIGASAGGLEAIHEFFDNMPESGNLSFIIIQHLSPDYKSLLVELVSKHTHMQVYEASHDQPIERNCVYVIPNDKLLTIKEGKLLLNDKNFEKSPNTAIDIFLRSLAEDQGSRAIAIILSGTGTDGTRGVELIHQCGGMVLVQDPMTAKFNGMPNSIIAAGFSDYILSPELMPEQIFSYINEHPKKNFSTARFDEKALPEILSLIEKSCGYDFHNYKSPTIIRRIVRRLNSLGKKNFEEYLEFLRTNAEECKILGKEFLIGVTKFFRDAPAFQVFESEILPDIIHSKKAGEILKIWVTACSTGQEAYSMAILVDNYLYKHHLHLEVKIFATDLDIEAIEHASRGTYSAEAVADMDADLLRRYFIQSGDGYTIIPSIRKQIVFARHNILKDPPFIKNDVISCRNMLIYMNNVLQRKVLSTLLYSLNTGGTLFLGPSETPSSISTTLTELNGKWKFYRKLHNEKPYNLQRFDTHQPVRTTRDTKQVSPRDTINKDLADDFRHILTEEFSFAAIYIDSNHEIKDAIGDFRRYLTLPEKIISLNVLKMVSTDLSIALNSAIRRAQKEKTKVVLNNVRVRMGETEKLLNLYVKPASAREEMLMIVFGEGHETSASRSTEFTPGNDPDAVAYINELEEELKETKTNLQMAVESLETTNEELQSSNEELLSANEELQSSNEELQSLNEELHTLNTEHQLKIKELVELNDDLNNYFRSTEIGQVFVSGDLRIRKFNSAGVQLINLIESDVGRPIEHISNNLRDENLIPDVKKVLRTERVVEREVELNNKSTSLMRIIPYIRKDGQVDGAVITFYDITNVKELNSIINGVFNSSSSAIMAFRAVRDSGQNINDFSWIAANYASDEFLRRKSTDYIGKSLKNEAPELLRNDLFEKAVKVVETEKALHTEMLFNFNGHHQWYELIANKMMDGLVLTLTNINEKKLSEEKLRKNYHELVRARENLKTLNANLEEKIADRTKDLASSEERFRLIAAATSDVVWDRNLVGNQIWWSESFYKIFGFETVSADVGRSDFWLEQIHPEDRSRVRKSLFDAINRKAANWSEQYRFRKADGSYANILDRGAVISDEYGVPYRMVGAMADISNVKEAENRVKKKSEELQSLNQEFKFVTDFMPQIVWATQPDGYHDFFNKGWYDYTGQTYDQSKSEGWSKVLHPEDLNRTLDVWTDSLKTGNTYEIEYRLRRHDGAYRWFLARAVPLKDEAGRITKWFGTCTDVHDQKMMSDVLESKVKERTEQLQRINSELESTNSELMQFASVASHDLKEPLRKIHMFSNIIKERYLTHADGAMDYMERIISSSARMTKLINDLLTFSRLSVNAFFEKTDLNKIVGEVLSDLELSITEKNAVVESDDLPEIDAVPGQMRQVFQNIISNALKFTHRDKAPHIRITCDRTEKPSFNALGGNEGNYCRISISDNGIGFDEQYAQKIFTIFQRLHAREKYEGTGIGLSITKKIIEKHNGLITAHSSENQGSTFTFILPVRQQRELVAEKERSRYADT